MILDFEYNADTSATVGEKNLHQLTPRILYALHRAANQSG